MLFTWIAFIIQALFANIFGIYFEVGSLPIVIIAITSLFLLFDLSGLHLPKVMFLVLFLSYLLRIFFLFFDLFGRNVFVLPNSGLDSEMFNEQALQGLMSGDYGRGHVYSMVIGVFYSFFGYERIIPQFFNVLLSMQALLLVYKTLELYKVKPKISYLVLVLIALMPNYAILSSILLRESLMIFLYILSFYCFSRWLLANHLVLLVLAYVSGLFVSVFHSGSIFLVAAYTVILFLYDGKQQTFHLSIRSILIAVTFSLVFLFIFQNYYDLFFSKFANIEEVGDVTDIYVMGESGYSTGYPIANPVLNFIINTPVRMFYFIFSPLPWDWRGVTDVIAFVFSSLFYGGILLIAVVSVVKEKIANQNSILILLLIISIGLVIFAWGVSNAGTALRHRDKFIGLFTVLLGLVLNARELKGET